MKSKRLVRNAFILLFLLRAAVLLPARQGIMAGADELRVSQTEFFDIIYAPPSAPTAQILYEHADDIFRELAAAYGLEAYFRLPVVITSTVEQFNAYYADSPFNRIVIYDTAKIEDLAVFSQTLLSTFTHELTHAVTFNHKSRGMRLASKIFGDIISAHYITVTSGMAEGATVAYESSKGQGRLNDPYALQQLRQAKIENLFPSYSDVKGASEEYPVNSFYYFNGAFAEYLQSNYGMEKYALFWYRCINGKNLTTAGAFKKVYGIKLNKAWQNFKDSYRVPEVLATNPLAAGQVKDFFKPDQEDFSIQNQAGALYSDLCLTPQGLYYIDKSCSSVFFVDASQLDGKNAVKPQKLFRQDYIDYLSASCDGRFLALGYYSTFSSNIKHRAKLYDVQKKKWINIEETNITNPAVLKKDDGYYFVCQKYQSQKYSLCVDKLDGQNHGQNYEVDYARLELAPEESLCDFTDLGDGTFAFIKSAGLQYSICLASFDLEEITEYPLPQKDMRLRNLSSAGEGRLVFSWATKETLPRLGLLDLQTCLFTLSQENISGGLYSPLVLENGSCLYVGHFFRQNRLLLLNQNQEKTAQVAGQKLVIRRGANPVTENIREKIATLPYKPFSPLTYAFDGILLPFALTQTRNFTASVDYGDYSLPFGLTYITSLPWYSGLFILSGGYGNQTNSGAFSLEYQGGSGSELFTYDLKAGMELDQTGFKQAFFGAGAASRFDFGRRSAFLLAADINTDYGRVDTKEIFLRNLETLTTSYSNAVHSGPGTYERSGFTLSAGLMHNYLTRLEPQRLKLISSYDLSLGLLVFVPKLLPLTCINNFTYNLPVKIKANLFPLAGSEFSAASIKVEALLFAYEIQRAIPGLSALFINDVLLTLQYSGGFNYSDPEDCARNWHLAYIGKYVNQALQGQLDYRDYATVKLSLGFTPNIGSFANNQYRNNFYFSYSFGKSRNLPSQIWSLGLEARF